MINNKKHRRENLNFNFKPFSSKKMVGVMVMFIFFSIFFTISISAFEFDNVKTYDDSTNTVHLKNSFAWIIPLSPIADATRITPQIYQVRVGENVKIAEFEINPYQDYTNFLQGIQLINKKTNQESTRKINVKYLGVEDYTIDDYSCDNKTGTCSIVGNHTEQRESWLDWDKNAYANKKVTIGLFMNIGIDETFEWIPTLAGKEVVEWAVVTSGAVETTDGYYTVLTYLNNGTFNTTENLNNVSVLVVAGGGGGGESYNNVAGGGGAGGFCENNNGSYSVNTGNYNIIVGVGGKGAAFATGGSGQNSSFNGIVAIGGGGGGADIGVSIPAGNGGSGGGRGTYASGGSSTQTNSSGVTCYGNAGGGTSSVNGGSGGGGATTVGITGVGTVAGGGGTGKSSTILNGTSLFYSGGGGGSSDTTVGIGGNGGGGTGGLYPSNTGMTNGTSGTGGGGGGAIYNANGSTSAFGGSGIVIIKYLIEGININLLSPTNNTLSKSSTNYFTANITITNVSSNQVISNVSLLINGTIKQTNTSGISGIYNFTVNGLSDGNHNWTVKSYGNNSIQYNANNGTLFFTIDSTIPTLNITYPTTIVDYHILNNNLSVNWTVSDVNLDTCLLQYEGVNRTVTCLNNQTQINITNNVNKTIIFYVNDTFGNVNSLSRTWDYNVFQNNSFFNASSYETSSQIFTTTVMTLNSVTPSASLIFNNTKYTGATITSLGSGAFNISKKINIPSTLGSLPWNHNITLSGVEYATTSQNQQVNLVNLSMIYTGVCGSGTLGYANYTFKDEGNLSVLSAKITSSTFYYWLGTGTVNKTLTYTNTTANPNYVLCFKPQNTTLQTLQTIQYEQSGYPQRIIQQTVNYTNSSTNQSLYLLATADGIYVTFQIIDSAEKTISNVFVNASRLISGVKTLVSNGYTGADGGVTFWLNPNFLHDFHFVKTRYTTVTSSFFPTQSAYTITLGSTATTGTDYSRGINYTINPKITTQLSNDTAYSFNLSLSSSFWTVTDWGFVLKNSTGNVFNVTTSSANGGTLNIVLDTQNNTDLVMEYWYTINSTQTNATIVWKVFNNIGTEFSVNNFFTDLKAYTSQGIFGIDDFALGIIAFLVIFIFAGILSYQVGLTNPASIMGIIFSLTFLMDVVVGIVPNPVGAITHFPTFFVAIIFVGLFIREAVR